MPRVSDTDLSGSGDEPALAQCPRAPHPPAAGPLPVRVMTADLRPSPDAQDVVSFGAMEGTEEEDECSCGSVVEHCVSSATGCGFNSQGTHIVIKHV